MDIFEKAFGRLWPVKSIDGRSKQFWQKSSGQVSFIELERILKSLESFSGALLADCQPLQITPSLDSAMGAFVGLKKGVLYLPSTVGLFADSETNRKIYINFVLQIAGAHHVGVVDSMGGLAPLESRLVFLEKIGLVNAYLDSEFAGYGDFQRTLFERVFALVEKKGAEEKGIFDFWREQYLARTLKPGSLSFEPSIGNGSGRAWNGSVWNGKKWSRNFGFLWFTLPCLEVPAVDNLNLDFKAEARGGATSKDSKKTELTKPKTGDVEVVDLEKETGNPVTHAFEKIDTADEYQGGYKLDSGDDELENHSQALKELDLSKVTRGGEAALSIYKGESQEPFGSQGQEPLTTVAQSFLYPEWSTKSNSYQGQHCQLFEDPLTFSSSEKSSTPLGFREKLEAQHAGQLAPWRRRIQSLLNVPLWSGRLKEGDEIDFDSYVRDFPTILQRRDVEGRWYARKLKRVQEISVLILFDQSLSTDSWVKNFRVLDIILDSIGLAGILFEDVIPEVEVAGTWSVTRHQCGYQIYKKADESWDSFYEKAIQIEPQGYTRLGPAIRHGTKRLAQSQCRKRLLLLLTDGKPTDLDGYEGRYGIYDVKKACLEAEARGILPFALTIDQESKDHFPKMFNHYKLLLNPQGLSEELYQIFLRLIRRTT
jgi:nitric oxide reductase NorD protein